ncbi:unnamed protein product [Closterium sp. Naga37s-1]|nr:unnamed protein product [Closterium sp. Naga37s-1]
MLASAESAHESSDMFSSGVDSSLERELSSAGLTGFATLIKHAGLMPELELRARLGSALTVFAPTNVALMRADPALLAFLKLPRNAALLRDVLLFHVVARPVSAFAWEGSYETMQGAPIALHVDALAFQVGGTSVKQYRALTLFLNPLSPDERHSGEGAQSAAASAQLSIEGGAGGSSTVVVHTVNALLLPPSVDDLLLMTAGDLSIAAGMGEGGRQLAESSGSGSPAPASSPNPAPAPPVQPSPPPPTPASPPPPPKSGARVMVCDKCAKKLSKVIVPDKWKEGASNTTESGGRKINENKLLSKKKRYTPYASSASFKCIICKQQLHQEGKYCHLCSYKKGVCAMCGKQLKYKAWCMFHAHSAVTAMKSTPARPKQKATMAATAWLLDLNTPVEEESAAMALSIKGASMRALQEGLEG